MYSSVFYFTSFLTLFLQQVFKCCVSDSFLQYNGKSRFCQTLGLVLRLRVDFVLPLSQEEEQEEQEEEQEEEPTPKFIRRGRTRRLKFGT